MNLRSIAALVAAASSVGVAAYVQQGPIVVKGDRAKPAKKVCKSTQPPTGTRLGSRRICRTAADWETSQRAAERTLDQQRTRSDAMDAQRRNEENALAKSGPR